jgi:hypothetical protein
MADPFSEVARQEEAQQSKTSSSSKQTSFKHIPRELQVFFMNYFMPKGTALPEHQGFNDGG